MVSASLLQNSWEMVFSGRKKNLDPSVLRIMSESYLLGLLICISLTNGSYYHP